MHQTRTLNFILGSLIGLAAFAGGMVGQAYASWPLKPVNQQHPVRAGYLDLRLTTHGAVWHDGADVVVNQTACSADAPTGGCARVYAIAAGKVWFVYRPKRWNHCGVVRAGRWGIGHVIPVKRIGIETVHAGQLIGWSCKTQWHVHISLFNTAHTRRVDPLTPEGAAAGLYPQANLGAGPTIVATSYDAVTGELDAHIESTHESRSVAGMVPLRMTDTIGPYGLAVNGVTLWTTNTAGLMPVASVVGPETLRNVLAPSCGESTISGQTCGGARWWRLGTYAPGDTVNIDTWDAWGNHTTQTLTIPGGTTTP